jgi:hypothetical protein
MNKLLLILVFSISNIAYSATHRVELNIGIDTILLPDSSSIEMLGFGIENEWIEIELGDTVYLTFANDTLDYELYFNGRWHSPRSIEFVGEEVGVKVLRCDGYVHKGLNRSCFNWSLRSIESELFDSISMDREEFDQQNYQPDHFLINRNWAPNINKDERARVVGKVGDSIYLNIINLGESIHSLHFHGYHAEIVRSSKFESHTGRIKDTFPIYPGESLTLLIVPDKPGEYPVHDHNLAAVLGNGRYGNGMFTTMLISE